MKVGLLQGVSTVSKLIRFQTRSVYSHACLLLEDTGEVIEAWHKPLFRGGVYRSHSLSQLHTLGTAVDVFDVTAHWDRTKSMQWLCELLDSNPEYDFRSVFRFLSRTEGKDDSKWFCSELVAEFFRQGGLELVKAHSHDISPRDLYLSPYLVYRDTAIVGRKGEFCCG